MLFTYNYIEVLNAYSKGAFPTLNTAKNFFFYLPPTRPLIPLTGFHISGTLNQKIKNNFFEIKYDTDFDLIISGCVRNVDKWITPELIHVYKYLFKIGYAHSVGCYKNGKLVGGIYGLALGAGFFAESMFSTERDASKIAMYQLSQKLHEQGFEFLDCQMASAHVTSLGAVIVDDKTFAITLGRALKKTTTWGKDLLEIQKLTEFDFQTDRLKLTTTKESDEQALIKLGNKIEMHKFTLMNPIVNHEGFIRYLKTAKELTQKGLPEALAIRLKSNDQYIGSLSVFSPNKDLPCLEISIELDPAHWGKGYAKEAINDMLKFVFDAYPIYRLQARVVPENESSHKLFLSLGFKFEGTLKNAYWFGKNFDLNFYSITRDTL